VGGGSEANAQKLSTPLQININSPPIETYWNGAHSAWGGGLCEERLPYRNITV